MAAMVVASVWGRHRGALHRLASCLGIYAALTLPLGGLYRYPWEMPGVLLRVSYAAVLAICEYIARGCKPLFDEWTLPFEVMRTVLRTLMVHYSLLTTITKNAKYMRQQTAWYGTLSGMVSSYRNGTEYEPFNHNGLEHVWVRFRPRADDRPRRRCVLLYIHGGGFTIGCPRMYVSFASNLLVAIRKQQGAEDLDVEVLLANYRKTPEHKHPVPPQDTFAMYKYLTDIEGVSPSDIIVSGDSAGGGLALATLLRVRDNDPSRQPVGGLLVCPFVDLEMRGDERKVPYCVVADRAIEAITKSYPQYGDESSTWGDASPVHCNLRGLPPTYILSAEFDYLLPHSQRLLARAKEDGVQNWHLDVHKHMVHVFVLVPEWMLPSAAKGIDVMAKVAVDQFTHQFTHKEEVAAAASF